MTVDEIIKNNISWNKWLFSPAIPNKKLDGACITHEGLEPNKIIALFDNTLLGSGKAGFVLTGAKIYYKAFLDSASKFDIEYSNINSIKIISDKYIEFTTKDNKIINTYPEDLSEFDYGNFIEVINNLITADITFKEEAQSIPLDSENNIVKVNFLKILINLSMNEDGHLNAKSYASIIQLISRLNFSKDERIKIREYMLHEVELRSNDELLQELKENMPENRLHEVHISLVKEAINTFRAKNDIKLYTKEAYKTDKNIVVLKAQLNISEEELSLIEDSIINDEKIFLDRDISDDKIKELFSDMAGKAAAVGLPLAAVYLTGTIGFSAAGLTSGLAALGMGGVLGFSSMVTGIGVALIIGVVSYKLVGKGIRAITGDDSEKYKQREFLLQNVMKQSQRAFNFLIEDINYLTSKAIELLKNSYVKDNQISDLYKMINVLSASQTAIMDNSKYAEKEKILIHLPKHLDINRLNTITSNATLKDFRELILGFYKETVLESEKGPQNVFVLDETFPLEELEELLQMLNDIGYNDIKNIAAKTMESAGKSFIKGLGELKDKFKNNI